MFGAKDTLVNKADEKPLPSQDPMEEEMAPTPVFLHGEWTERPRGLQSMGITKSQTWLSNWAHTHQISGWTCQEGSWYTRLELWGFLSPSVKIKEPLSGDEMLSYKALYYRNWVLLHGILELYFHFQVVTNLRRVEERKRWRAVLGHS